jgi:hypothetical protein
MDDLRFADGFVFQQLVPGPLPIGALARRLGVSQQAASKGSPTSSGAATSAARPTRPTRAPGWSR